MNINYFERGNEVELLREIKICKSIYTSAVHLGKVGDGMILNCGDVRNPHCFSLQPKKQIR